MRDMSNLSSASRYTKDGGITVCMDARPPPLDDAALPLPRLWPPPLNDAADRRFFFAGCLPGGLTMRMPPFLPMRLPFGGRWGSIRRRRNVAEWLYLYSRVLAAESYCAVMWRRHSAHGYSPVFAGPAAKFSSDAVDLEPLGLPCLPAHSRVSSSAEARD